MPQMMQAVGVTQPDSRADPIPDMTIYPRLPGQGASVSASPLLSPSPSMESLATQPEEGPEDCHDEGATNEFTNDERQSDASFSMHSDPCLAAARQWTWTMQDLHIYGRILFNSL